MLINFSIFSEKYALPMAPLWSVQFGPGQRRVVVDEIVMHEKFAGYNHDIGAYIYKAHLHSPPSSFFSQSISQLHFWSRSIISEMRVSKSEKCILEVQH